MIVDTHIYINKTIFSTLLINIDIKDGQVRPNTQKGEVWSLGTFLIKGVIYNLAL